MNKIRHITYVRAALAALTILVVTGCSTATLTAFVTGKESLNGPATFIETDPGATTADIGPYQTAVVNAISETLKEGGEVFAAPITADSAAGGAWMITAKNENDKQVPGSATLSGDARVTAGTKLDPTVAQMLRQPDQGADVVSAMQRAIYTARGLPRATPKVLVIMMSGEINAGGVDTVTDPPVTLHDRQQLIKQILTSRAIPAGSLRIFNAVYLAGIGVGVQNVAAARALQVFWPDLIRAAGGKLISSDSVLHLPTPLTTA
jgi:hypothetical protein